jgi:hypothetical protein
MNSSSSRRPSSGRSLRAPLLQLDLEYESRVQGSRAAPLLASPNGLVGNPRNQECTIVEIARSLHAAGPCLATARRRLRAPAGAVDDIDLQLLEGDALIYAIV